MNGYYDFYFVPLLIVLNGIETDAGTLYRVCCKLLIVLNGIETLATLFFSSIFGKLLIVLNGIETVQLRRRPARAPAFNRTKWN